MNCDNFQGLDEAILAPKKSYLDQIIPVDIPARVTFYPCMCYNCKCNETTESSA